MTISSRLLNTIQNLSAKQWRHFCNIIRDEVTVQTFCDINVNIPYNVKIKPLDVHMYHNCDLLKIEIHGVKDNRKTIKHLQDGNNIKIFSSVEDYDGDVTCCIHAPVKANLNINAKGNISAGVFSGSKLILNSTKGSIFVEKFNGENIELSTVDGDISLKGAIVAANIKIVANNTGGIRVKRLQGLDATLKTNEGSITVDSSYCDNVVFESNSGDLNLQNIHKNSKILLKKGKLNLSGLDGKLEANLQNTTAEIQISRILENSKINMTQSGELKLLLSEQCQEDTQFEVKAKHCALDPSVKLIPGKSNTILYLTPMNEKFKHVQVNCECGPVNIQSASWINMLKLKK